MASGVGGGRKYQDLLQKGSSSIRQWDNQIHVDPSGTVSKGSALQSIHRAAQEMHPEDKPVLA